MPDIGYGENKELGSQEYRGTYGAWQSGLGGTTARAPWDPRGEWTSPHGSSVHGKWFSPHIFMGNLLNTRAAQDYQNIGDLARTQGVEGARRGEAMAIQESNQMAANQGLGRGFAQQQEQQIRQQGTMNATDAILAADMEQRARRFQLAAMMASSLIESHKALSASWLQRKAIKAGKEAGEQGFLGNVIGSVLGLGGALGGAAILA